ncbi:MAG: beta-galactosidase [Verrucomicrobiota bacterium]
MSWRPPLFDALTRSASLRCFLWSLALLLGLADRACAGGGALEVRKGYFWDPTVGRYFYPHGIAYQSWNPPVGANQSLAQVEYDLIEFKKMHANSVRAEMVWNVVEIGPGVYDWTKPDHLVALAEKHGLKLFVLIGFQYAPDWCPPEWKALNDEGNRSFVLNYENANARAAYSNYISQVTSRYRNSRAIGGWILGNEYAYFDLWEPARHYLGYDPESVASFHAYLRAVHQGDIARANAAWGGTKFADFDAVPMPTAFPADRNNPIFEDLIQWRKRSIANYVAVGARSAREHDPNHLLTYSMIGGLFGDSDNYYTCEDGRTIVQACREAGVPLDFWSINNYAIAGLDSELRIGDYGIAKHQAETGLPVMLSETGHTSTEDLHAGAAVRQAAALPTQLWESVLSGAMGVHIFTWNDRDFFSGDYFPRERGFGIVEQGRRAKVPAFDNCQRVFERMDELDVANLLGGSVNPPADIQIFWSQASDLGWPRANQELNRVWNTLKRLGYQPGILRDEEFDRGDWRSAKALMLSRAFQLAPSHLDTIASEVVAAGVNVHAAVDLPGQFNAYHQKNPDWEARMRTLFGLNVSKAVPGFDGGALANVLQPITVTGRRVFGPFGAGYRDSFQTWKYWSGLSVVSGSTVVTYSGNQPALHLQDLGTARTAITTLALGDVREVAGQVEPHNWEMRYDWLHAVYRDHFAMVPPMELTGVGSRFVFPDFRVCRNGSILIGLLNGHTNAAQVVLKAPTLLKGRLVEDLTSGGVLDRNSNGELAVSLAGDQYLLLYATTADAVSLVNPGPVKLWFESPPGTVWPSGKPVEVVVGYETGGASVQIAADFESDGPGTRVWGSSPPATVSGRGTVTLQVPVPDADLYDPDYRSSRDGGRYAWRAVASSSGRAAGQVRVPVRLSWGVRPEALPGKVQPGQEYPVTVRWEDLPGYLPDEWPTSLDRAPMWDSLATGLQHYSIAVELLSGGTVVARGDYVTDRASSSNQFQILVPKTAKGPFTWTATARTADGASDDLFDGFEGRLLGADTGQPPGSASLLAPWTSYNYAQNAGVGSLYFDTGIQLFGTEGSESAFLIYTNPPSVGTFSGFGIERGFPVEFSLPASATTWKQYSFSCDVREAHGHPMRVGLQLKSPNEPGEPVDRVHAIQYVQDYNAPDGSWQHIEGTLNKFVQPDFLGRFDFGHVIRLVINFEMLKTSAVYQVSLDNIRWNGPERTGIPGEIRAVYRSDNDSPAPLLDSDGDGIPDIYETGTGHFVSETNTGTKPGIADSDGDGQSDGDELLAGTDPNRASDFFRISSSRDSEGKPVLSWIGKAGRHYDVSHVENLEEPSAEFFPVPGLMDLVAGADGVMEVRDASAEEGRTRYYRVSIRAR